MITLMNTNELLIMKQIGGIKTKDGSLASHFSHTVAITPEGPLILTN